MLFKIYIVMFWNLTKEIIRQWQKEWWLYCIIIQALKRMDHKSSIVLKVRLHGANFRRINTTGDTHIDQLKTQEAVKEVFLPVFEKLGNQKFLEFFKSNLSSKPNKNLSSCPLGSCTFKFLLFNIRAAIGS